MLNNKRIEGKAGLIVCLFLFFFCLEARSQVYNDIKERVFSADFTGARQVFLEKGTHDWRSAYYAMNSITLEASFIGNDSLMEKHNRFFSEMDKHLDTLRAAPEQLHFLRTEMYLQQSIIQARYDKQWDSFLLFRQAMNTIDEGEKKYPDFLPLKKSAGLTRIILSAVPENYQWLLQLLGWRSSLGEGLESLRAVFINIDFSEESKMYYYLTQAFLLDNAVVASNGMDELFEEYPNELVRLVYLSILEKASRAQKIIDLSDLSSVIAQSHYISAEAYTQKSHYDSALVYFEKFLEYQKGVELLKDAYFKMALCYKWQGNSSKYQEYIQLAKEVPVSRLDADINAAALLQNEFNDDLMRCRLATDGGFYELALSYLDIYWDEHPTAIKDPQQQLDIYAHYRLGRIWQKTGRLDQAIREYDLVLARSPSSSTEYYVPNSALLLGRISLDKGELDKAEMYLKEVLKYKNHEYKKSLDKKAKALISIIEATRKQ